MNNVILVNRKNHPCNPVRINKEDMLKDDVIVGSKKAEKPPKKNQRNLNNG